MSKWEWKKLKDICEIEFGTRVVRKKDGGSIYPVYGGGGATFKMDSFNREDCLIVSRFAMSPQCTRIVKGKFFLNDSGLSLKSKDLSVLSEEYLNTIVLGLNDDIYALGRGTAQRNLNVEAFKELNIPVPPLSEQKRIVKFLDEEFSKIETLKTNAETNLKNVKELFETTLEKELNPLSRHSERSEESSAELPSGWEWKTLDEFSTNLDAKRKPVTKKNRVNGNYPYYGASGIVDYVDSYIYDGKYLLISEDGANLVARSTPIAFIAEGKFWVNNHAHIIETMNEATLQYLVYFFENLDLSPYVKGMAQPKLSQDSLYKIQIPLPPLSVQKEIVARLDKLSEDVKRLEANYKQIIADCEELKKSILKKTFEGES